MTLPPGTSASAPKVRAELREVEHASAHAAWRRIAGYASTGNRAFLSNDGRTTFIVAYPPSDRAQAFEDNPKAAEKASAAFKGMTVAGAAVHLTGFDALSVQSGGGNGPGLLVETLLGGFGALIVLVFVFALVPGDRAAADGDRRRSSPPSWWCGDSPS